MPPEPFAETMKNAFAVAVVLLAGFFVFCAFVTH
jgi:hypothetical protein